MFWFISKYLNNNKNKNQHTFCYCPYCRNELVGTNSYINSNNFVYFKCSICGGYSKWQYDFPVPFLINKFK